MKKSDVNAVKCELGATATEYALLVAMASVVVGGALLFAGDYLHAFWTTITELIPS